MVSAHSPADGADGFCLLPFGGPKTGGPPPAAPVQGGPGVQRSSVPASSFLTALLSDLQLFFFLTREFLALETLVMSVVF